MRVSRMSWKIMEKALSRERWLTLDLTIDLRTAFLLYHFGLSDPQNINILRASMHMFDVICPTHFGDHIVGDYDTIALAYCTVYEREWLVTQALYETNYLKLLNSYASAAIDTHKLLPQSTAITISLAFTKREWKLFTTYIVNAKMLPDLQKLIAEVEEELQREENDNE